LPFAAPFSIFGVLHHIRDLSMKTLGTLLCTGMMVWAAPALAGFEFTPRVPEPARQAPVALEAPAAALYEPMPIIPAEPVSAEPLAPLAPPPAADPVISEAVSRADEEQVYVRRQRAQVTSTKMIKSQPMEAEALLTATANKDHLVESGRLVINPYPLEGDAIHGGDGGRTSVEQAMMEESGMLRPVKTPGSSRAGLVARARPATAQPLMKENDFGDDVLISSNMTPFPGERTNVADIEAEPVPAMPKPAKLSLEEKTVPPTNTSPRRTTETSANAGFSEAVGFGRDLPLALALSQVVPPEYSYSFARNVNVGTTVSWQGGKPWNQVLDEMLAQNGMKADIEGGQVTIHNAS
jgi:hypothetical protein